jgi:hypothetical protein
MHNEYWSWFCSWVLQAAVNNLNISSQLQAKSINFYLHINKNHVSHKNVVNSLHNS